ncbi:helix-turn-helix domain-containing protein [Pseudomonas guariconensis]|uniref:IclR family transcriptional regulator n=1 Tax=Pseudomonas TaxID=286 RepID=UPI00209768FF|nr:MULTISPECIES: helix-turn-helix domain-containing protein [Pseudomonas]MCO7515417.1 helix-turn-helix domain-containing protein [Pseudomonas putida]MCO7596510.1 helix-turn-helix domain-containing protein [Pseudomonas guariconensis]MCO7605432.1 helix-turn-helix domain-containing protein [Pseudomonas guariconensis]MCO7634017.1 helix-turn-helix domain-containing protein [Pseudomonas guariconensis]MCU7222448.1 helix-turn-helix domain-containing protein [Pseudomonas brassicacearum]
MAKAETVPSELRRSDGPSHQVDSNTRGKIVMPLVRALDVLSAFTPHDGWLGNKEIAERTGLPASTVSRFLRSLVALGYVGYCAKRHLYCLAAPVLSLGYAATAHSDVQRLVRAELLKFASSNNVTVLLAMRDRLDLVALESCTGTGSFRRSGFNVGTRISIASNHMGHTLLASLPALERAYLLDNIARRMPDDWSGVESCLSEASRQLRTVGFCYSLSKLEQDLGVISVPMPLAERGLFVLACLGSLGNMSKARILRELGPQLVALADHFKQVLEGFSTNHWRLEHVS